MTDYPLSVTTHRLAVSATEQLGGLLE